MADPLNADIRAPQVSVVMPVYNGGSYVSEAIRSILGQSFGDFEFIIINDGSTDDSEQVIKQFSDPRIVYRSQMNAGLAATLNTAIGLARGEFIARQDQDDVSHPRRLEKQVAFLRASNVILLGTRARVFSDDPEEKRVHDHASSPALLRFDLLFDNPFVHSSVMFRKADFMRIGPYNTDKNCYEDYELWSRFAQAGDVANLEEILVDYRHHAQGMSKDPSYAKQAAGFIQSKKNLAEFLERNDDAVNDLAAWLLWRTEKLSGVRFHRLRALLGEIAAKLSNLYPSQRRAIRHREAQYVKVLGYRIYKHRYEKHRNRPLIRLFLRVYRKMRGYHPHIVNA